MIMIQLKGGLGNQLFQYCFARSLAHDLDEELFVDISYFGHYGLKHVVYGLHPFNIKGVVGNYPLVKTTNIGLNGEEELTFYPQGEPVITTWGHFNEGKSEDISKIQLPCYFNGYFQQVMHSDFKLQMTERFFKKNIDLIHEDLQYMLPLSVKSQSIINDMKQYDSIALHIRRGDYTALLDFGLCSEKYYRDAIDTCISQLDNPKFFIFCEDMDWVINNLEINAPHRFVNFEEENESVGRGYAELLKVMSSCDHFIMANSTFSWWAAFLGENSEKMIISPKPWYQSRRVVGVETIDNIKPIEIVNNNAEIYDKSNKLIYSINEDNFLSNNMDIMKIENSYMLKNTSENSELFLNKLDSFNNNSQFIVKISLESNCFGLFKLFFKTKNNQEYSNENSFSVYYYDNDKFDHYLLLPETADISSLMITPGNLNKENYLIINSLQIKEI